MLIALCIACTFAGVFAGYSTHQRMELQDLKFELSARQDEEVRLRSEIVALKEANTAHVTSIAMLMKEVSNENHAEA